MEKISLEVREGEFLAIVGPSGCGKSTLLSLLAGLEHTDEGDIRLGTDPVEAPGRDRLVMFQQDALFPWLNALENVLFGLRLKPDLTDAEIALQVEYGLRRGYAWTYTRYARADSPLHAIQLAAQTAHRGLWSDPAPVAPWDWRH